MILYEVISTYHLLCACTDRMNQPQGEADLLIFESRLNAFPHQELLTTLFRRVIPFDIAYQLSHTEEQLRSYFLIKLEARLPLTDKYERILCACGHHA